MHVLRFFPPGYLGLLSLNRVRKKAGDSWFLLFLQSISDRLQSARTNSQNRQDTWPNLSCLLGLRLMLLKIEASRRTNFLSPLGLPDCLQYDQCTCCWVEQKFKNKVGHKESRQRSKYERRGRVWNDNTADILGHHYCSHLLPLFVTV